MQKNTKNFKHYQNQEKCQISRKMPKITENAKTPKMTENAKNDRYNRKYQK